MSLSQQTEDKFGILCQQLRCCTYSSIFISPQQTKHAITT